MLVELDPMVGHEQQGIRPCIAASDPPVDADQRFPLIAVVPSDAPHVWCRTPPLLHSDTGLTVLCEMVFPIESVQFFYLCMP